MPKKHVYKKPSIKVKRLKINFFRSNVRFFDSFDALLVPNVFAQTASGTTSCFEESTKILMANDTVKEISTIQPGDLLYSYDLEKKRLVKDKVSELHVRKDVQGGYLLVNNFLKVTGNHRLFVNDAWARADSLQIGDTLLDSSGKKVLVESIQNVSGTHTVYSLHMEGKNHNYFAEFVLAHNQMNEHC